MEPRIQYAQTSDGVNIAYYTVGDGVPFISLPVFPACHLQLVRQLPPALGFDNGVVASGAMHVRYDPRGFGLSDRDVDSFDLDAMVEDLHAVITALELPRVILYAIAWGCPIQIAYAARHPERVWRMIVHSGTLQGSDVHTPMFTNILALASQDWRVYCETIMHVALGWSSDDQSGLWAGVMRESITPEQFQVFMRDQKTWDARDAAGSVRARTLVLHQRDYALVSSDMVRRVVTNIPGAEFVSMDGDRAVMTPEGTAAMMEFLGADRTSRDRVATAVRDGVQVMEPERDAAGMAVILFADIVDSTALSERLGNATFRERSRTLEARLRDAITAHAGAPVAGRTLGDGVLATFGSASDAIAAAEECAGAGEDIGLALHLGLHAGDVIREEGNVYGQAVSIASRVSALSGANELLVSSTVRDLARASTDVAFEDRGERELKGVSEAVRLYEVRWRDA